MNARPLPGAWHFAMTHSAPGGLRELWNDVAAALETRGHATCRFVLYPDGLRGDGRDAAEEGWHHLLESRPNGAVGTVRLLAALIKWMRATRPQVIVSAMPLANVILAVAATLARSGTRVIATHHSPIDSHSRPIAVLDSVTGRLPAVAAIVGVSRAVGDSLSRKSADYRAKVRIIPNALPHTIETLIESLRGEGREVIVPGRCIAVGRLAHQKNYPLVLRAFAQMQEGTLDIIGGGEDEVYLKAMARELGLEERVNFLGQLPRHETLRRCAAAEVFIQVSHYEGHSLALIEAARLGLPLVVSDVPVQVEGITNASGERCGQTVALHDPVDLARTLNQLLADNTARSRWAIQSRQLGLEASSTLVVDRYEALVHEVTKSMVPA